MNGFYLYCIREKGDAAFSAPGLFEQNRAFALPVQNLEAIVSQVPMEQMDRERIQQKAQDDLNWIKGMAQRHEAVIESAMNADGCICPVIPMRFGTVFLNQETVEQTITHESGKYSQCLASLHHRQEWSAKLYVADPNPIQSEVLENNPVLLLKKKQIQAMPRGMAYFFQSELNEQMLVAAAQRTEAYATSVFDALAHHACQSVRGKLLEKELTGRQEPMILNAIFLIPEDAVSAFKQEVEKSRASLNDNGLQIEFSGPWPPYHFAKV
ncbi:MAG: GvpL/GvpF family gas vesicle protein [Candidatus Zhuqueibacterota bacterium]